MKRYYFVSYVYIMRGRREWTFSNILLSDIHPPEALASWRTQYYELDHRLISWQEIDAETYERWKDEI